MIVRDLIENAMKEARDKSRAIGEIAEMAQAAATQDEAVRMTITVVREGEVLELALCEPFEISAAAQVDFESILKVMARIATRDAGAAKDALRELGLSDKVIQAIVEDRPAF